jgi:cytosine/adenosine deaminase-related metal-dependent hydrolase
VRTDESNGLVRSRTPTHRVALLLPAPLNLHSHAFQRAMAGLTEAKGPRPARQFLELAEADVQVPRPTDAR